MQLNEKGKQFIAEAPYVKAVERAVNQLVAVPLTQNQFNAVVSLTADIGIDKFKTSALLRHLNDLDFDAAAAQFPLWNLILGDDSQARRNSERELFEERDEN
jgi:lysozyme